MMGGRDDSVDFAKGMLMLGIIYGHMVTALFGGGKHIQVWLHSVVRTYDLPFFMLLSGFFLQRSLMKNGCWSTALNRIGMIGLPIVFWTLIRGHINVWGWAYYFLWAVFVCSLLCCLVRILSSVLPLKFAKPAEWCLFLAIVTLLHLVYVPWNMFYLFPFFIVGFYLKDIKFEMPAKSLSIVTFLYVVGLCFWSGNYTPWRVGPFSWRDGIVYINVLRFMFALVGIIVMSNLFKLLQRITVGSRFYEKTLNGGKETLGLYILHVILISSVLAKGMKALYSRLDMTLGADLQYCVAYVVAPLASWYCFVGLTYLIRFIRSKSWLKWMFGLRLVAS